MTVLPSDSHVEALYLQVPGVASAEWEYEHECMTEMTHCLRKYLVEMWPYVSAYTK